MTFPRPALRPSATAAAVFFALAVPALSHDAPGYDRHSHGVPPEAKQVRMASAQPGLDVPQKRLEFPKTTLWHFLESMRTVTGVPFRVDPAIRDRKITYMEDHVTWRKAIEDVASRNSLHSRFDGTTVWMYPEKGATASFLAEALGSSGTPAPAPAMGTICFQLPVSAMQMPAPPPAPPSPPPPPPIAYDREALGRVGIVAGRRSDVETDDLLREQLKNWDGRGVLVLEVVPETAISETSIKRGDVITSFGDRQVNDPNDILAVVKGLKGPEFVTLEFRRGESLGAARIRWTPPGTVISAHDRKAGPGDPPGKYGKERKQRDATVRPVAESDPKQLNYQAPAGTDRPGAKSEKKDAQTKPATETAPAGTAPAGTAPAGGNGGGETGAQGQTNGEKKP